MCRLCRKMICPPTCPNSKEEATVVFRCSICGEDILSGEKAYLIGSLNADSDQLICCEECVLDRSFVASPESDPPEQIQRWLETKKERFAKWVGGLK